MNVTDRPVNLDPNLIKAGYNGVDDSKVAAESKQAQLAPILFGSNVLVSYGITDIEALVAQLRNENADTRLSLKLKSLSSIADGLSTQQLQALEKSLALASSVKELEKSQNDLQSGIDRAKAELVTLQMQTESLERQIENARENAKEYNKSVEEQQAKKAEIDRKIAKLEADASADHSAEIADLRERSDALGASIRSAEDALAAETKKIADATASLEGLKTRAAELEKGIAEGTKAIERNKNEISGLRSQISACLSSIDESSLKTLAKEVAALAPPTEEAESPHDVEKREEKAEAADIVAIIRDSLDAIARDILDEVAERRVDMV